MSAPSAPFLTADGQTATMSPFRKASRYSDENEETTILMNLKHNTEQNKSGQMIRTALIFLQSPNHQGNQMTVFRAGGVELSHEDRRASGASGRGPTLGRGAGLGGA